MMHAKNILLLGLFLGGGLALGHVRLHVSSNPSKKLRWSSPGNVGIVISSVGSDDIADGSHFTALRNGIAAWNSVSDSDVQIIEDTDPAQQARTDWGANGVHLVMFDESDTSGFFPGASGTVAITPVLFDTGSGNILDADILYNGKNFAFTTSMQAGRFDVQDVGTHELGHFLGLDHTGWAGGTMFPYVSPSIIEHRSLSMDEANGMRDVYPSTNPGEITGTVRRASDNSAIPGAHITCRDATTGRSAAGTLADSNGNFSLDGLPAGTYVVVAHPFKGAVDESNLQSGHTIETDFDATEGSTIFVPAGIEVDHGDLIANDPAVSPVQDVVLGSSGASLPLRVVSGTNNTGLSIGGNGLTVGSTIVVSDPDMTISNVVFSGTAVSFALDVPANELPGHVDVTVSNANGTATLPAAFEVTPADPTVSNVTPSIGSSSGATALTISGTGFNAGARIVLGPRIYVDGDPGVSVVDATTITLTTQATTAGSYDLVVIDPSGVEGRASSAFGFTLVPAIQSVFPPAGSIAGGTELLISGQDFITGTLVEIDGVAQTAVTLASSEMLCVMTEAKGAAVAGAVLRVTIPGGAFAESVFTYANQADPVIQQISPAKGSISGGTEVTILGSGFTSQTQVKFGVEADGTRGLAAASLTLVDANTLVVTTPAFSKGSVRVLVQDMTTGQADTVDAGFSFQSKSSGGGGGCYTELVGGGPFGPREMLLGSWWVAALFVGLALRWGSLARPQRA